MIGINLSGENQKETGFFGGCTYCICNRLFFFGDLFYNSFMQDCVFCKIINKEATANILFENMICLVFAPLNPIIKGHILIVPKTHYQDIFDIDTGTLSELVAVAQKTARNFIKVRGATGINLLHASGKDAQQSIFHFHLHLVPRYPNDGLDLWLKNKL